MRLTLSRLDSYSLLSFVLLMAWHHGLNCGVLKLKRAEVCLNRSTFCPVCLLRWSRLGMGRAGMGRGEGGRPGGGSGGRRWGAGGGEWGKGRNPPKEIV